MLLVTLLNQNRNRQISLLIILKSLLETIDLIILNYHNYNHQLINFLYLLLV